MNLFAERKEILELGKAGESGVKQIKIPIAHMIAEHGSGGTFNLWNKRVGDKAAYPVVITYDTQFVYWTPNSTDLAYSGFGEAQVDYVFGIEGESNYKRACSDKYTTRVSESVETGDKVPNPATPWVTKVEGYATRAENAAEEAEEIAEELSIKGMPEGGTAGQVLKKVSSEDYDVEWGTNISSTKWEDIIDKPSTFPPSEHNHDTRYYLKSETDGLLNSKVDKVEGKSLSTNDYDNTEKQKVSEAYSDKHTHANKNLLDSYTQTEANLSDAVSKRHGHSNKELLDTYTQTDSDITDAVTKKHEHSNKALLDTYDQTNENLTTAVSNSHTHSNKTLLDSYDQTNSDITDSVNKKHSHTNKDLLDTYAQTEVDLADSVSKKHSHSNKALLDTYTQTDSSISDAVTKKHSHDNKELLDSYDQDNEDLKDSVAKRHEHDNKGVIDTITQEDLTKWNSVTGVSERVTSIENLIPDQATAENKLADKNFVNSSIATGTGKYISNNGQPFTSVEQLEAYSGPVNTNDYAFVTGVDEQGNTYFDRYKATKEGTTVTWAKEYRLNNSSFTATQWSAINSGITSEGVSTLHTHANKNLLDTYNQTNENITDAVSKKHEHSNKSVIDSITQTLVNTWNTVTGKVDKLTTPGQKIYGHDGETQNELSVNQGVEVPFVTSVSSSSTNQQIPSAKAVYDVTQTREKLITQQASEPTNPIAGDLWIDTDDRGGVLLSTWGNISGTLSNQTDLQTALNSKVGFTNYASDSTPGVLKTFDPHAFKVNSDGIVYAAVRTNQQYSSAEDWTFIGKRTLENVIAARGWDTAVTNLDGHTVAKNVPADAKFTDTVYDDTALAGRVTTAEGNISSLSSNKLDKLTTTGQKVYSHNGSTQGEIETEECTEISTDPCVEVPIVTSITSTSTNQQLPTAKSVYDIALTKENLIKQQADAPSNPSTGDLWIDTDAVSSSLPTWGNIIGTLSNQSDLQTALNSKIERSSYAYQDGDNHVAGTVIVDSGTNGFDTYQGWLYVVVKTSSEYSSGSTNLAISKGTLENVLAAKVFPRITSLETLPTIYTITPPSDFTGHIKYCKSNGIVTMMVNLNGMVPREQTVVISTLPTGFRPMVSLREWLAPTVGYRTSTYTGVVIAINTSGNIELYTGDNIDTNYSYYANFSYIAER